MIAFLASLTFSKSQPIQVTKRLNISRLSASSVEFKSLRQGEFVSVKLKLPGRDSADYIVKRSGNRLILNDDIIVKDLTIMQTQSLTRNDQSHTFGKDDLYRWPGGNVPVAFDNSAFDPTSYAIIKSALDYFNVNTGIEFRERTNEEDYVFIKCEDDDGSGRGGASPVGRQRGGSNVIVFTRGKFNKGTVIHELMHALGIWHEQSRPDRDNFIAINFDNVKASAKYNFQQEGNSTARSPYDYCSIMHYSSTAFAINSSIPVITCKNGGCPSCMGAPDGLSPLDKSGLDEFYREIGVSRFPTKRPFTSRQAAEFSIYSRSQEPYDCFLGQFDFQ
jgi:hypothetical protein